MIRPTRLTSTLIDENGRSGAWRDALLQNYLAAHAATHFDQPAIIDERRSMTYGELDSLITRVAAALRRRGIAAGDAVSWQLPNWAEAFVIHHAALRIGAVSNPIIPIYRHREIAFILRQARARIVFAPAEFRGFSHLGMIEDIRSGLPDLESVVVVRSNGDTGAHPTFESLCAAENAADPEVESIQRSANDVALLLYTSGTTSDPKGVLHTHNTLDYENRSIVDQYGLQDTDVIFMPSPVGHITGVLYGLHLPFMLGSRVVLQDIWDPNVALRLIANNRCSLMIAATPFLHGILYQPRRREHDLGSLRTIACGGADVPPELICEAERSLGCFVTRIYGSSEFPTLSSGCGSDPLEKRATTDGRPIGIAQARLADKQVDGIGELLVRGPDLFVGYLDSALNEAAFDELGWFRTGDLARIDSDGYIQITGRLKDIIIRGGEKISAKEIEDLLFEHPAVADVAVVGMPDPVLVERSCAYVVPKGPGAPSLGELVAFLEAKQIARQKLPERLEILTHLPRTASGKVQKFKLRDDIRGKLKAARKEPGSAN